MNNNIFSNKKNFKKIGISIIAIFVIVTALYNVQFQSVTKYKAQQQSLVDEYNLNSEKQSGSGTFNSEINGNGSEQASNDNISTKPDASINESSDNQSINSSEDQNKENNNASNNSISENSTLSGNTDNNSGAIVTQASSVTNGENKTTSGEYENMTCYIEIRCDTISSDMSKWTNKNKDKSIVPQNGVILGMVTINVTNNSTVLDVLKKASIIYNFPIVDSLGYIKSINQLEQLDAGSKSGWLYWVNNLSPSVACSSYTIKNGDSIKWQYTCNYGNEFDKSGKLK